ncbi:MAG: FkbM family methyltransferase [Firmicutes bacterium]|nr:FkbM family methyltransferase [Bacillota bacterium]
MGNYLLYSEDLAGFVALNVLKEKQHRILGVINCSGRLVQQALEQGFAVCQNVEILPSDALNQVDGIMIGVATEPLATQLKKELKAQFPQKKVSTLLDPEYLPDYLALRQPALEQLINDDTQVMPVKYGKENVLIYAENKAETKRARRVEEKKVLSFIQSLIRPRAVIYDIGANIGIHSLILAREDPDCQIHAFEPETLNFWKLLRNIGLNKLANITPHLVAAGAKREVRNLSLQGYLSGLGQHSLQKTVSSLTTPVQVWDLDSYVRQKNIPLPDLVKIDVEGFELQVLKGMNRIIKAKRPHFIIEVHEALTDRSKVESFLKKHQYELKEIARQRKRGFIYAKPVKARPKEKKK